MTARRTVAGRTVTVHRNEGIRKRCGCSRKQWTKCSHPWHGNFSHNGREYRVSLHKSADKPADYVMLKTEAEGVFTKWKAAVLDGKDKPAALAPACEPATVPTLSSVADTYLREYVRHPDRRKKAAAEMARQVQTLCDARFPLLDGTPVRLGDFPLDTISKPVVEAFRQYRRQQHEQAKAALALVQERRERGDETPIPEDVRKAAHLAALSPKDGRVSTNRLVTRLRHLFAWAIGEKGIVEASPFLRGGVSVIKLDTKAENPRQRRLEGDEESRLLAGAGDHLRTLILAALETGMRRGELLGLQWQHVRQSQGVLELPPSLTKTGRGRLVVITPRLAALLEMRRCDPDGEEMPPTAYVFGDAVGGEIKCIKTAWRTACRKAGITGLHFHDLRREAGSRLLETPGVPLHVAREFLGQRDVSTTNTYLSATVLQLRRALEARDKPRTKLAQESESEPEAEHSPSLEAAANALN